MTDCGRARDRMEAFVDGELRGEPAIELRRHLAACGPCRAHYAEATSLPGRLATFAAPEPPASLVGDILRRVGRERVGPLRLWGPLAVELGLVVVALWYLSGVRGLTLLAQRTGEDVAALLGWVAGQAELPAPPLSDVFLLLICGLLLVTTLYHLTLLSRQGPRLS